MYDTFMAALRCPVCGRISPADDTTNMTTKLRDEPDGSLFRVGDALAIHHATMEDSGYYAVQPPAEPVRIGQIWECPYCHHYPNWAEIVVGDGRIVSMEAIGLDHATLDRLHYLDEDVFYTAETLASRDLRELPRNELVPLLRRLLGVPACGG